MIDLVPPPVSRQVLVLGGHVRSDALAPAQRALEAGSDSVLIAGGYPLSQQQRRLVETTIAFVNRMQGSLDAILVASSGELVLHVRPGDRVEVLASGFERARLARAVKAAGGELVQG